MSIHCVRVIYIRFGAGDGAGGGAGGGAGFVCVSIYRTFWCRWCRYVGAGGAGHHVNQGILEVCTWEPFFRSIKSSKPGGRI